MQNKVIQADLSIFTHIPAYSDIFRNYSVIFRTLCNPGIPRTQALCIFLTGEPLQTSTMKRFSKRVNVYSYFRRL